MFSKPALSQFTVSIALGTAITVIIASLSWARLVSAKSEEILPPLNPQLNVAKYVNCLANQDVTLVSAHRGGPKPGFPENALESLKAASMHGPMLLEVDIRETADGQLVLLHDTTLERTTTGNGKLSDYTLSEISELRLLDNDSKETIFAIPTLQQVLQWADERSIVQLDVKRGIDYAKVAQAVVDADAVDSTLIIAYRLEDIITSLSINKDLSFSYSINSNDDLKALDEAGVPRDQIVAWTGVVNEDEKPIWPVLESLDIPFAAGAFWDLETQIIETNNTQPYVELAKEGIDVIGSDLYWMAYDTLATQQDISSALETCEGR